MKIKIHEFRLVVLKHAVSGGGDDGQYEISKKSLLTITEHMLNQQAVVETLLEGVNGVSECCSRIHIAGSSWLVLGDIRPVCYTNDVVVTRY
jgi:hypothetical protein